MGNTFKEKSAVSISLLVINFMLITTLASCIIIPIFTSYIILYPDSEFNYLTTSQVILSDDIQFVKNDIPNSFELKNGVVSTSLSYLFENHFYHFIIQSVSTILLFLFSSYALWLFRKALMSVENNAVFEEDNAKRFRIISLIFLIFWIFKWLTKIFSHKIFDQYFDSVSTIAVQFGDLSFGTFTISVLVFILSLVLKKAQDLHQEQKLTV